MGFGISIFLMAVGAVLAFAVPDAASGVNFDAIGLILLIIGAVGLAVSAFAMTTRRETHEVVETDTHGHVGHSH